MENLTAVQKKINKEFARHQWAAASYVMNDCFTESNYKYVLSLMDKDYKKQLVQWYKVRKGTAKPPMKLDAFLAKNEKAINKEIDLMEKSGMFNMQNMQPQNQLD